MFQPLAQCIPEAGHSTRLAYAIALILCNQFDSWERQQVTMGWCILIYILYGVMLEAVRVYHVTESGTRCKTFKLLLGSSILYFHTMVEVRKLNQAKLRENIGRQLPKLWD